MLLISTIKKRRDFKTVYNRGKSFADAHLVLVVYKNRLDVNRLGISISKKVGCAVVRNKLRRRVKEIFRMTNYGVSGFDIIVIVRAPSARADFKTLSASFSRLMKRVSVDNAFRG